MVNIRSLEGEGLKRSLIKVMQRGLPVTLVRVPQNPNQSKDLHKKPEIKQANSKV